MQGKKSLSPQLFYQVSLDRLVPEDNFYRQLGKALDFGYLYKATAAYCGREGQQSIDPIVFFKILLVGYLNNINSDQALIRFCADRLGIRLFLGYDLQEQLPCHSTISRTRQLNYAGQIAVDDAHHVITGAVASTAGTKDSMILPEIVDQTIENLKDNFLQMDELVADAGYSS